MLSNQCQSIVHTMQLLILIFLKNIITAKNGLFQHKLKDPPMAQD